MLHEPSAGEDSLSCCSWSLMASRYFDSQLLLTSYHAKLTCPR